MYFFKIHDIFLKFKVYVLKKLVIQLQAVSNLAVHDYNKETFIFIFTVTIIY